jgi:hypothetical protein
MSAVSEGFARPSWSAAQRRIDHQGGDRFTEVVAGHPSKLEQKYGLIVTVITIAICVHTCTCDSSF